VPESERWLESRGRGATMHWATRDLLGVLIGAAGPFLMIYLWAWPHPAALRVVGSIAGFALALAGYLYPVRRYLARASAAAGRDLVHDRGILGRMLLGAALSGVALLGTWGSIQWAPSWADQLSGGQPGARAWTQVAAGCGAICGTIAAALLGGWLGRRFTYSLLCVGSLVTALAFFQGNSSYGPMFLATAFLAGGVTASFYGWLPLYLPELFPTNVRATGQGFAFNFGRILAAVGALQTGFLMKDVFGGDYARACSVMSFIYIVGLIVIRFAPETRGRPLPE
jgi:hypothetical protein